MSRRGLRLLLVVCALSVAWLLARSVIGLSVGFLFLTPALILALPLLAGRYIGAERLSRTARARSRRRHLVLAADLVPRVWLVPPRGGLLIAASLAVRPPPLAISAH